MTGARQVIEEAQTALDAEGRVWLEEQLDRTAICSRWAFGNNALTLSLVS